MTRESVFDIISTESPVGAAGGLVLVFLKLGPFWSLDGRSLVEPGAHAAPRRGLGLHELLALREDPRAEGLGERHIALRQRRVEEP